jgi:hypothetical protein
MSVGLAVAIAVVSWTRRARLSGRRSPLTQGLLRPAGHTLRNQFDEAFTDVMGLVMLVLFMPAFLGAMYGSMFLNPGQPFSWLRTSIYLSVALVVIVMATYRMVKTHGKAMNLRMGWDAEVATGQELDQLMRRGAVVFHDFPAGPFNIDHVMICSAGIYAVETKSRMKPGRGNKDGAKVTYDGKALLFPDWTDTQIVEQARRQAKWLASELSKAVGEQLQVVPVVALPGWFVTERVRSDVRVLNPKNFHYLLESRGTPLPSILVDRIAYQVEQRCRDVAPAYSSEEKR